MNESGERRVMVAMLLEDEGNLEVVELEPVSQEVETSHPPSDHDPEAGTWLTAADLLEDSPNIIRSTN